jgi:hypothetical protein
MHGHQQLHCHMVTSLAEGLEALSKSWTITGLSGLRLGDLPECELTVGLAVVLLGLPHCMSLSAVSLAQLSMTRCTGHGEGYCCTVCHRLLLAGLAHQLLWLLCF